MSDDLNQEIKFTADGSGVKAGVSEIKRDLASIGPAADKAGQAGADGLNKIGAGGENAARRLDQTTKNMIASLQRQTAALESGGTATRQYQESIARLRGADLAALKPYLDQLDAAKRKAGEVANANKGLEGSFGGLGAAAGLARTAIASALAGLTVGTVVGFVRGINDGIDALNDIKDATGSSIENISALEDVALRTGASMDVVSTAMVKFNQVLGDAKPGSAQALALKAIGLSAEELRKLDPAEALRQTAVALSQFADDGNKARLVQELFGKSIKEVAPFLNDLAEKTALVGKVTDQQAAEAEKLNKQFAELSKNSTDAARSLVSEMLPAMNAILKAMREGGMRGAIDEFGNQLLDWGGNAQRKRIASLKKDIASLSEESSGITFDVFGVRGGIEKQIDSLNAQLKIAQAQYYKLNPAAGGGRGVVNPAVADVPKQSVGDLPDAAAIKAAAEARKKAAEEARKEMSEQAKLSAELSGLTGSFAEDWARLTKIYTDKSGLVNVQALTEAQAELLKKQPAVKAAIDAETKSREAALKVAQASADARNKEADGINAWLQAQQEAALQSLKSVQDRTAALEDEGQAVALSMRANISLAEAVERVAIARLEEKKAGFVEGSDGYKAIEREIEARKRLAEAVAGRAARESSADAAKQAEQEWKRTADSIENSLTDALLRGFESGKDFAANFRDTVSNMFKTLVLRPIISAVISPVAQGIASVLGGGPGKSGLGGVASGIQTASNLNTLWGAGSQALYGASVGASGASLLGANAVGMVGGDALGALISANGAWAGVATGAQAAAQAAVAANVALEAGTAVALEAGTLAAATGAGGVAGGAAAAGGGVMGALGAIPGWGWALAGVAALAGLFGKQSTPHMGALAEYSADTGVRTSQTHGDFGLGFGGVAANEQTKATVGNFAQTMGKTLDSVAEQFGQSARFTVATAFADDSSKDGAWGGLRIAMGDKELVNWNNNRDGKWAPREFADGEQGAQQYAAELAKGMREALQAMDLPEWANGVLDALGEAPSLESLSGAVAQINAADAALDSMGKNLQGFSGYTDAAITALLEAAGGMDSLVSGAQAYYDNFYSSAERTANTTRDIADALAEVGLQMPRTRAEFRAMVEEQMALGESGAEAVAALLGVSSAFAGITDGAAEVQSSLGITADSIKTLLESAVKEASSPEDAKQRASSGFEELILQSMFSSLTAGISSTIMNAAVGPLVSSLVAGATASATTLAAGGAAAGAAAAAGGSIGGSAAAQGGASAGGAMAAGGAAAANAMAAGGAAVGAQVSSIVASAQASIAAYTAVLKDPAFRDAIGQIGGAIGDVAADLNKAQSTFFMDSKVVASASGGMSSAMNTAADSIKQLTDSILDEVKRLRGAMVDDSPVAKEVLLAQFATATAQAKAGDKEALAKLPELSQAIEAATELTAASSIELARMRGWLANSLEETLKARGVKLPKPAATPAAAPTVVTASSASALAPVAYSASATTQQATLPGQPGAALFADMETGLMAEVRELRREVALLRTDNTSHAADAQRLRLRIARTGERTEGLIAMQKTTTTAGA